MSGRQFVAGVRTSRHVRNHRANRVRAALRTRHRVFQVRRDVIERHFGVEVFFLFKPPLLNRAVNLTKVVDASVHAGADAPAKLSSVQNQSADGADRDNVEGRPKIYS